ncbi:LPXTG-motif cell wall-anchored protein [Lentzea atacamensis]|uniref:LPXTG-motif cell wall-anchored protein n=1 Tax=Lentzea atacamensis TaxID=531938 RepID=A0A316IJM0_9PSEU|nr:LPXTG cell wall anchor domain-containing protein [Lentzea atacamensis]PWK90518.1 LPXTG-motif cell wall-anchored protein [Lentzea atacamensis]
MKKQCAVAITAAFLLAGAALPASAQDETITVEGVIFLDRNGNEAYDAGETVRANGPGVWVTNLDTNEKVAEFRTDANGRYRAVLPKGPRYMVINQDKDGFELPWGARPTDKDLTLDFPLWGRFIDGFSFVDTNGDGVKQAEEKATTGEIKVSGKTQGGAQVDVAATPGADGSFRFELPVGAYTVTAPDLVRQGLALAKPLGANDIDWLTGQAKADQRNTRIDARYFEPKADSAVEDLAVAPAKDTYTVGEQIDVRFKLANKGDVPGGLRFVMFGPDAKLLSHSGNVTGANGDFATVAKVLPGESVTVELKFELTKAGAIEIWPFADPFVGGHKDVDRTNQGTAIKKTVNVVEKSTTTPPTSASPSETTAPTTTTTPAVAKAGNKTGLASTGASPLGFLALGGVLLAAGLSVFFVARRRRS